MTSAALYPRRCWFKHNLTGIGPCEGPLERAHLIRAQVIAREIGSDFETLWDPRAWVPGCVRHHRALDHSRQIRIPRAQLPAAVEQFAVEHEAVAYWLEREYGPVSIEAGGATPGQHVDDFGGTVE